MSHLAEKVRSRPRLPAPAMARAIRLAAGVTQDDMAQELEVHRVSITRWEAGRRRPRGALAGAYAQLLDELRELT